MAHTYVLYNPVAGILPYVKRVSDECILFSTFNLQNEPINSLTLLVATNKLPPYTFTLTTEEEVFTTMFPFPNKLTGYDKILSFLVKDLRYILTYPLTTSTNLSIPSGTFPKL